MKIRLHFPEQLSSGTYSLNAEVSHYLCRVLRVRTKDSVFLFNESDGEWSAKVIAAHPKQTRIVIEAQTRQPAPIMPLKLFFAPIKKSRISTIFAMATELGVTDFQPVKTRYTHNDLGRVEKIQRQLIEASEQCERLDIPNLLPQISWTQFMQQQNNNSPLLACLERGDARAMHSIETAEESPPNQILIGPEGGFSSDEYETLQNLPNCIAINLGAHILRSETAVASALAQWQLCFGNAALRPPEV